MPKGVGKVTLPLGHFFLEFPCEDVPSFLVNADTTLHSGQDGVEHGLLEVVDGVESHGGDHLLLDFRDLAGVDGILAVVRPELILPHVLRPGLPVVLPVKVVVAVHGGLVIKGFWKPCEGRVVGDHRVLDSVGDEVPVAVDVLCIVEAVLPVYQTILVGQEVVEFVDDEGFFLERPVGTFIGVDGHEGDADSIECAPSQTTARNVTSAGFEIERDVGRPLIYLPPKSVERGHDGFEVGPDGEVPSWPDDRPVEGVGTGSPEVPDRDSPKVPLDGHGVGVDDRDDFGEGGVGLEEVRIWHHLQEGTPPFKCADSSGESPEWGVPAGDDDVRFDFMDLSEELLVALLDDWVNHSVAKGDEVRLNARFLGGEPGLDVVTRGPGVDEAGGEASGSVDTGFEKHLVELEARRPAECFPDPFFFPGIDIPNKHDLGRDWPCAGVHDSPFNRLTIMP